jgi:hypothetical protein
MNYDDYSAARDFLKEKLLRLTRHEGKNFAKVGFPIQSYAIYPIQGRIFYSIRTDVFREVLNGVLIEAIKKYPQNFGTGNATDVLEAIYKIEPIFDFDDFIEFLRTEQFCCIIENVNGAISPDILRIDLFRRLDIKKEMKVFTGGIFHALKHFSFEGKNLSTGNDIYNILNPDRIIEIAIKAFFFEQRQQINKKTFYSLFDLNEKYNLKFVFYFEEKTGVYFINTIFKKRK